jgi:muramoyltetrapeptide carboxypeptidase
VTVAPPRVEPGTAVAIVSPSFPAVARFPHRVERGSAYLESLGPRVRLMPNAGRADGWASASPEERAADIHAAFRDDEVAVVLAAIGGNHSNQLLPQLDYDLIGSRPKVFQGYSDVTVLHWALLRRAGLRTFHGPALVPELGEYPEVLPYTDRYLRAAWLGEETVAFEPAPEWTDELLDWNTKQDSTRPRRMKPGSGWVVIRGGRAEGPLLGGCLEAICWHLKGSAACVEPEGAILFLEISEETPSPAHVDAYLADLEQLGVRERAAGLLFGRPPHYDAERARMLLEVVAERTASVGIPALGNVDLGHTDPMVTLCLGARARLDADRPRLELLEPATAPR